jgi:hypothetical protein
MINRAFHPWKVTVPAARKKALFSGFPIGCCDHNTLCLTLIRGYSSLMERDPYVDTCRQKTPKNCQQTTESMSTCQLTNYRACLCILGILLFQKVPCIVYLGSHADIRPKKLSTNYWIKVICTCQNVNWQTTELACVFWGFSCSRNCLILLPRVSFHIN